MSGDDEFDDFLARRKPLFQRPAHELEPPAEVDRLVLRQAREAIRPSRELHEIRGAGWGMPLALAATVLVTVTIVLNVMVPRKVDHASDVHQVAQRIDAAQPNATMAPSVAPAARAPNNAARPAAAPALASAPAFAASDAAAGRGTPPPTESPRVAAKAAPAPAWRRDTQSWLAEIDKLRAQGKIIEADAEMAEYKRQHRAYAASPDR